MTASTPGEDRSVTVGAVAAEMSSAEFRAMGTDVTVLALGVDGLRTGRPQVSPTECS